MKKFLLLVAAALLAMSASGFAQLGLGMAPMRVELKLAPGQQYSGALRLSNQSGNKVRIRAEALDFNYDGSGTPQFERNLPSEANFSCRRWLTLNPMEIELDGEGYLLVRYTLRLPAELAQGSYNCAAGFTTLPAADAITGMGMRTAVRIVAALYVVVGNPVTRGELKGIRLERAPTENGWRAVIALDNSGSVYFRPQGKLEVLDSRGKVIDTQEFLALPVLPKRTQRFLFPLKAQLEAGSYKLRVRVDVGTGEIQEGEAEVVVEPPPASPQPAAKPKS